MCYRMNHQLLSKKVFIFLLLISFCINAVCQINEPPHQGIYDYIYRMAQKGYVKWRDYQLPLDRRDISNSLSRIAAQSDQLTRVEARELQFYKQEYTIDEDSSLQSKTLFSNDQANRFRVARFDKAQTKLFIDPVVGFQFLRAGDKNNVQYFSGVRLGGYFGKRWGFNFLFRDNTDRGDTLVHRDPFAPVEAIVPTIENNRLLNFSHLNYNIGYKWSNGALSVGQENLSWGYGLGGNVALSGRAPSFPYIKFDYRPLEWLHFSYFHGWLQSNIIDSSRSYNTGTGIVDSRRDIYHPKFIAHHALTITPVNGLDISVGESMVYSDQLNIAYLIPINFFKIYDQHNSRYNIRAGDNSQFFGLISSRDHVKKTHIYAQLFIDEVRASKILDKDERRNQWGYTFGLNRTDFFLNYFTVGLEYSRINPFVYNNLLPTQTYQSHSYNLGDWMGNNADRLYLFMQYNPFPKLRIKISHQKIRKGEAGTLQQQYFQSPQPPFLFSKLFDYEESAVSLRYELINKLLLSAGWNQIKINYENGPSNTRQAAKIGISYGL